MRGMWELSLRRPRKGTGVRYGASVSRTILSRGYVLVTDKNNKVLKTVGKVEVGDNIGVRFSDGSLVAGVKKVYKKEEDKADTA